MNIIEGLGNFGLWSSLFRQWDLKNAKRLSTYTKKLLPKLREEMQIKIDGSKTWISTQIFRRSNLWFFQTILFLLKGTKVKTADLKHSSQLNWVSKLEATSCWKWDRKTKTIIRKTYGERENVSFSKTDLKRWFWRKTRMKMTNHNFIQLRWTSAIKWFSQFWPKGFLLHVLKGTSW